MKIKLTWVVLVMGLLFNVSDAWSKSDEKEMSNRQMLCANLFRQAANSFELSPTSNGHAWSKGQCRQLTLERAQVTYYLITSCLQTKCGETPCRIDPKYFQDSSCPYAADYIDIPAFLEAFAYKVGQYGGDTDAMEPYMQKETNIPLCIIAPEILRNAALGCEKTVAKRVQFDRSEIAH